jgi:ribonuclease E
VNGVVAGEPGHRNERGDRGERGERGERRRDRADPKSKPQAPPVEAIDPDLLTADTIPQEELVEATEANPDRNAPVAGAGTPGSGRRRRRGGRNRNRRDRDENGTRAASDDTDGATDEAEGLLAEFPDTIPVPGQALAPADHPVTHEHENGEEQKTLGSAPLPFEHEVVALEHPSPARLSNLVSEPEPGWTPPANSHRAEPVLDADPVELAPEVLPEPAATPRASDAWPALSAASIAETEVVQAPSTAPEVEHVAPAGTTVSPAVVSSETRAALSPPIAPRGQSAMASVEHLSDTLAHAGLVLVQTDAQKLEFARQRGAAAAAPLTRVPRARKPAPPASSEPLVQIETRKG